MPHCGGRGRHESLSGALVFLYLRVSRLGGRGCISRPETRENHKPRVFKRPGLSDLRLRHACHLSSHERTGARAGGACRPSRTPRNGHGVCDNNRIDRGLALEYLFSRALVGLQRGALSVSRLHLPAFQRALGSRDRVYDTHCAPDSARLCGAHPLCLGALGTGLFVPDASCRLFVLRYDGA